MTTTTTWPTPRTICQFTSNPNQQDLDGDGLGSACDTDELPTDKEQCKNGGWELFYDLDGPRFTSQGDCVSFVQRGNGDDPAKLTPASHDRRTGRQRGVPPPFIRVPRHTRFRT